MNACRQISPSSRASGAPRHTCGPPPDDQGRQGAGVVGDEINGVLSVEAVQQACGDGFDAWTHGRDGARREGLAHQQADTPMGRIVEQHQRRCVGRGAAGFLHAGAGNPARVGICAGIARIHAEVLLAQHRADIRMAGQDPTTVIRIRVNGRCGAQAVVAGIGIVAERRVARRERHAPGQRGLAVRAPQVPPSRLKTGGRCSMNERTPSRKSGRCRLSCIRRSVSAIAGPRLAMRWR